ncbi:hypothetical protein AXG93_3548s1070 [Marchantia polymorpha subsp. ruderalis]|uniref:Uncharacterized protein n=1 Tax=Marchantia polymorpha subsp. ruderalis TaxID=1480154 RepID=A0A176VEM6_MARPO|nr:hypothetical protein AXG93_3548s1070 [Marchantia polymorpha subsp. ruderalis]
MKRLPFGVALARGRAYPNLSLRFEEDSGEHRQSVDFDGTLVAAGAGLGEKEEQLISILVNVLEGGVVKFTAEDGLLEKGVDVDAVIAFSQSLVVGSKELISVKQ